MSAAAPISVQLYSIRDAVAADLTGSLRRLAALGFTNVEPYDFVDSVAEYTAALGMTRLSAPSAHTAFIGRADAERVFDAAAALGIGILVDPGVPAERWGSRESVLEIAREASALVSAAEERGIRLGYHNHEWEFQSVIDGRPAFDLFAEAVDPAFTFEVDTYWAEVGGVSSVDLLRRLGSRVTLLHVKDGPLTRDTRAQVPVGRGDAPVVEILRAAPHAARVLEFDDYAGDLFDGLEESLRFVKEHG